MLLKGIKFCWTCFSVTNFLQTRFRPPTIRGMNPHSHPHVMYSQFGSHYYSWWLLNCLNLYTLCTPSPFFQKYTLQKIHFYTMRCTLAACMCVHEHVCVPVSILYVCVLCSAGTISLETQIHSTFELNLDTQK